MYVNIFTLYFRAFSLLSHIRDSSFILSVHHLDRFWKECWRMMPEPQKICNHYFKIAEAGLKKYTDWRTSPWVASIGSQISYGKQLMLVYNTIRGKELSLGISDIPPDWLITTDRRYLQQADVVVFFLPGMSHEMEDAIDKRKGQIWVACFQKSEKNYRLINEPEIKNTFDLWMCYQQVVDQDHPLISSCNKNDNKQTTITRIITKVIENTQRKDTIIPFVPIDHYYSPYQTITNIKNYDFSIIPTEIPGVNLNTREQLELLNHFDHFYQELPFKDEKTDGLRYYFANDFYSYSDAIFLYCMLRHLKPQKLIEVGSGFSSCVTLDTNELFLENRTECIFIEPFPVSLKALTKEEDRLNIYEVQLQDVPLNVFMGLKENDILFIDSTHVSKFNSDVNYIIHRILPVLSNGVYIHFHDIIYPFEYHKHWLLEGRAWNEQYILRAFLQYNTNFKIVLFNTYLDTLYSEKLKERFPLIYKNTGGSIWIKKV